MNHVHVLEVAQGSAEWHTARAGRLCASAARDMLAQIKSGEAAARRDLRLRLVVERLTGKPVTDDFETPWMVRGRELEPAARAAYESFTGRLVTTVGFIAHDDHRIGCSPDGLLEDGRGGLEIKVPKPSTHLTWFRGGVVPSEHVAQLIHSLYVTSAEYWDFCSWSPDMPEGLQLFAVRLTRDEPAIRVYEQKALAFLAEVDTELEALRTLASVTGALQASIKAAP